MRELKRSKDHGERPSQELGWTIHFGVFALMLAVTMPRLVRSFCPAWDKLDTSWAWMLGYSLQHHLQWGKSVLFTYGPLGFLSRAYFYSDHALWGLTATARLVSWFILGLGFACILRRLVPDCRPFARTTLPVAIGWIVGASFVHLAAQSTFLGVLLLALAMVEQSATGIMIASILSGSLLALGSLIKSTSLIISLFVLLVYPALWWYAGHRRDAPHRAFVPLLSFFITFCALWLISSQSLAHLPAYFSGTWAIASGYTPAMSIPGMPLQITSALIILSLLAAAPMGLLVGGRNVRLAQCLLLGVIAFWAWKEGFTRQDWGYFRHPMIFYGIALLIASAGTVLLSKENAWQLRLPVYAAYGLAFWFSMQGYPLGSVSYAHVLDNYKDYLSLISSRSRRATVQRGQTTAIRREYKLTNAVLNDVGRESVDVIPWSLMMVQGYRMRLVASPVLQSYSAYTPYLDRMNAHQIWDGGSADKIIYSYHTIDRRYPAFDEPATFRAILTCYRTEYPGEVYSVLTHVACARPQLLATDNPEEGSLGRWIAVPRQASYADIDVRTTVIGHITNILYKPGLVWLYFKLSDGRIKGPYRFIYAVGGDGLFVKYFLGSQSQADLLFSAKTSALCRIDAIKVTTSPPLSTSPLATDSAQSPSYAQHFEIRFLREAERHRAPLTRAGYLPSGGGRRR